MDFLTQDSKWQAETISYLFPFSDVLAAGETITGVPLVTVTVFSGVDANPSNLLYLGVSIIGGTSVEQRLRLGLPGVIYEVTCQATSTNGNTFEKQFYLGILPDTDSAVPNWLPLWETTQLYPVQPSAESFTGVLTITGGSLITIIIRYSLVEEVQSSITFSSGTLVSIIVPYNYSYESVQSTITFIAGTLVSIVVPYNYSHEDFKGSIALIAGTLTVVVIPYSYSHEDFQASLTFTGGTLV